MKEKVGMLILVQVEVRASEPKSDGSSIRSGCASQAYRDNHDRIFGKMKIPGYDPAPKEGMSDILN